VDDRTSGSACMTKSRSEKTPTHGSVPQPLILDSVVRVATEINMI